MAVEGERVIRRAYKAFADRDLETLIELVDLSATWRRIELQPQQFAPVATGQVLVFGRVRAWHAEGFLDSSNAWLWTLRGERVVGVRVFADPGEARRAFAGLL